MNPQQPQGTGQLINTQPAPQGQPDLPQPTGTQGANQAAANLGFMNTMQEHLLQHKGNKNKAQTQQNDKGKEKPQETQKDSQKEIEALRTEFEKKIEDMKKGITEEIKSDIKTALADDHANE